MSATRDIRGRLVLLAIAATVCAMVAGCGGGDDAPAAANTPEPHTQQAFAEYVAALLADAEDAGDCKRIEQISRRSSEELPCPAPEALREQMGDFEVVNSETYNANRSGVVDYEIGDGGKTTAMLLLLDYDGRWTVQQLDINSEQKTANASSEGGPSLKRAIRGYEAAVRRRDCEEIVRLTYRRAGTTRVSCADTLAATARLAKALKGDPGQRPAYNGGSRDYSFYSLSAYRPTPTHHTFTVARVEYPDGDRYFVSNVVRDEG